MRTKRTRMPTTKAQIHIFTGGLKEDVAQVELKGGELIDCINYQEIDGVYHGYTSIPGYEVTDGTQLASQVAVDYLPDNGLDGFVKFLLEVNALTNLGTADVTIADNGVQYDSTFFRYFDKSFLFDGLSNISVTPTGSDLDIESTDCAIDVTVRPNTLADTIIYERATSYRLAIIGGNFVFQLSSDGISYDTNLVHESTLVEGRTYHIEVVRRNSGDFYIFLDGTLEDANMVTLASVPVGSGDLVIGDGFIGNLEEFRFSKGTYRHYLDFDYPQIPYSSSSFYSYQINDTNREVRRNEIQPVPGSGTVLGVKIYDGDVFAVRDNLDLLSSGLYRTTSSGWATMNGSINPQGTYRWSIGQYPALMSHQREKILFWTSGVDFPQWLDDDTITDITSEFLPDDSDTNFYANNLVEFKSRLFLAYPDGRLVFSAVDDPLNFDPISGAGEIYMEDEIMDLVVAPGDTLVVFCRTSTFFIKSLSDNSGASGTVTAQYKFYKETFSKQSGAMSNSAQRMLGTVISMGDRGITSLEATDAYGSFSVSFMSKNVQRTLLENRDYMTCTVVHRSNNQYRMYFNNGLGLLFTYDSEKKVKGVTRTQYPAPVMNVTEGNDSNGNLILAFGSTTGYVYMMDSGTSFNGGDINTKLTTSYNSYSSPTVRKRFRKISLELKADRDLVIYGNLSFDYGDPGTPRTVREDLTATSSGGIWGIDTWGFFNYGSAIVQNPAMYVSGYGKNMSMTLATVDKYRGPHILNAVVVEYSLTGRVM